MSSNTKRFTSRHAILSLMMFSILALATGCSQLVSQRSGSHSVSSSLVDFLYPNKNPSKTNVLTKKEKIPSLSLPVKVGIAFLPSQNWRGGLNSEAEKIRLLKKVKASFGQHRFIDSIQIIPSIYLKQHGGSGFDTLDQLGRMYDIDIIALVSYDQLTQSLQNNASLLYWTIVGMYVIPGNENSVQTFVDTAVFDIRSRKMLLRAPGVSRLSKRSTAIGVDSTMIEKSRQGFNLAFDDMINNLNSELGQLKQRIREGHVLNIKHRQGYSGGGSIGGGSLDSFLLYLFLLGLIPTLIRWQQNKL